MFKKKRSSSSLRQAPTSVPQTTPSAATAAAQAFLKKQTEDGALSSSAAAAALRSHASSPVPVGEIQTKRMVRRGSTSSIGSIGSNNAAARQPFSSSLQRRGSNGSMSQRSFRSPSPGAQLNAPPVPALPDNVPPLPTRSTKRPSRASSIESSSRAPVTSQQNGAKPGMSASSWASADKQRAPANIAISRAQAASPVDGAGSPRSVNFSRPMSPPLQAPASPTYERQRPASALALTHDQLQRLREETDLERLRSASTSPASAGKISMVYDPASRKMVRAIIQPDDSPAQSAATSAAAAASGPTPMVFDAGSRRMVPATSRMAPIPERDYTHTASGQPARAMSLTSAHLAAARRMQSPPPRVASPEAIAMAQGKSMSPSPQSRRVASPTGQSARIASPPPTAANRMSSPPAARASSMTSVPPPSADQIRAFQTRAAAMLARPTSQVPQAAPVTNQRPTSMLMKSPSTESSRAPASEVAGAKVPASSAAARPMSLSSSSAGPESPIQRIARSDKSASPARTPRFLDSPLLEVTKHKPPPRSASPGKSAMKGHSPRNMSPADSRSRTRDSAAFSDAGSAISDESHTTGKKKKSVRVSFEEKPILVGAAANTGSPTETVLSPQYKKALQEGGEHDFTSMGDRPVLPSFGSVRGRKTPLSEEATTPEPESPTRVMKPSPETVKRAAEEPADSSIVAAPEIAVQPATPATEDVVHMHHDTAAPATEEALSAETATDVSASHPDYSADVDDHPWVSTHPHDDNASDTDDDLNQFSDAPEDPDERPGFTSLDAILESPQVEDTPTPTKAAVAPKVATIPAAAAPVVVPEPVVNDFEHHEQIAVASTADTALPLAASAAPIIDTTIPESGPAEDWELVKQYWSSLSEQSRREIEDQANVSSGTIDAVTAASETPAEPVPKSVKSAMKKAQPTGAPSADAQRMPPWPDKQYQQTAPRPAAVKRNSSDSVHMRSSLRSGGSMRTSMHEAPVQKNTRMNSGKPTKPDPMTNASAEAIALARQFMPKPQPKRRDSDGSDASDSSFKKRRGRDPEPRASAYNMKRSMRGAGAAPSLRSEMSPPASTAGRKTMRGGRANSIDSTTSEAKGGFFGLGKSKNKASKDKSKSKGSSGGLGFRSRFGDSSDEDSDGGGGSRFNFRSRFNASDDDSDDEPSVALPRIPANFPTSSSAPAMPAAAATAQTKQTTATRASQAPAQQLTPVRGIPRKAGQEDAESTDLSDSDDEGGAAKAPRAAVPGPANATNRPGTPPATTALNFGSKKEQVTPASPQSPMANGTAASAVPEGKVLETGTLRHRADSSEKRRSIFSFGHSRKKSSSGSGAMSESKWANTPPPTEPPARPETPSHSMAKSLRNNNNTKESPRSSSRHSIFRRRFSLGQSNSAPTSPANPSTAAAKSDFPYPPPPIPEEFRASTNRPNTSDGVSSTGTRPPLERGESTQTAPTSNTNKLRKGEPVFSERTGKKKKFSGLRRALGLHD